MFINKRQLKSGDVKREKGIKIGHRNPEQTFKNFNFSNLIFISISIKLRYLTPF